MHKKINKIFLILILMIVISLPTLVFADGVGSPTQLENPLNADSVEVLVANIVTNFVVPVGGVVVVFFIIYAGFLFIKAQGKPDEIDKAKRTLLWVVIGAAVLLGASVLANIVKTTVGNL